MPNFNGNFPAGESEKGPFLKRPTKVGSYAPNKLGLYDMHGNVYQWCSDLWDSQHVLRGCSWNLNAWDCRAAERRRTTSSLPDVVKGFFGIRLARVPSGNK
jgi:formylglycine-generating enzyme required for sulfatase activity